jgi:hypothetical protein
MGRVQERLMNLAEAEDRQRGAFAVDFQVYGDGDIHLATDLRALVEFMFRKGDLGQAEHHIQVSLQICQRILAGPTEFTAGIVRSQGELSRTKKDLQGWIRSLERLASLYKEILGEEHPISKKAAQAYSQATSQSMGWVRRQVPL